MLQVLGSPMPAIVIFDLVFGPRRAELPAVLQRPTAGPKEEPFSGPHGA